ncbi:hypothetical protein [Neotabrizicola sp. sgz301269]|uniref:hypothetical protein n=1 Tax=Neotabrizicola sp. sgz301269 TaxID=3276282 RepID=UPI00376F7998
MASPAPLAAACLVLGLAAATAEARSPRDLIFGGEEACYLRSYSIAHLAGHPAQRVRWIALAPRPEESDARFQAVTLSLRLRGADEIYSSVAYCENEGGQMYCEMEGDGGAFSLEPREGAVLVKVSSLGMAFEGAQDFIEISGVQGDDRSFLLSLDMKKPCP